jgi:hypothetical protein
MEHFPLVNRLHTDVLKENYGSIEADVIRHNDEFREAHLVDPDGVSRTYAVTFFPDEHANETVQRINEKIRSGGAIGITFREHDYAIRKNVLDVFVFKLTDWLQNAFQTDERYAKARLSEFYAKTPDEEPVIYGDVLEVYTPDFRPPIINAVDTRQINPSTEQLEDKGFTRDEVWHRIGNENDWTDAQQTYQEARVNSLPFVFNLREKARSFVDNRDHHDNDTEEDQ